MVKAKVTSRCVTIPSHAHVPGRPIGGTGARPGAVDLRSHRIFPFWSPLRLCVGPLALAHDRCHCQVVLHHRYHCCYVFFSTVARGVFVFSCTLRGNTGRPAPAPSPTLPSPFGNRHTYLGLAANTLQTTLRRALKVFTQDVLSSLRQPVFGFGRRRCTRWRGKVRQEERGSDSEVRSFK